MTVLSTHLIYSLQAVANESGINFISVKGPELLNMVCEVTRVFIDYNTTIDVNFSFAT